MKSTTVTAVQAKWVEKLPPLRFASCWAILTAAMVVFFLPVAAIAQWLRGSDAIVAAAVAAGVCWLGSTLALAGTAAFGRSGANGPIYTLAFGLVFNCALPFLVGMILYSAGGPLSHAGVFGLTVIFFQFALVVGTILSLCLMKLGR
jgi:hypothetical protein